MNGELIMNIGFMAIFGATVLNLVSRVRSSLLTVEPNDAMLDMMAIAPPRRSPKDIAMLVNQPGFSRLGITEQVMIAQDMVQGLIRPGMSFEETIHVRELFIVALIAVKEGNEYHERDREIYN